MPKGWHPIMENRPAVPEDRLLSSQKTPGRCSIRAKDSSGDGSIHGMIASETALLDIG